MKHVRGAPYLPQTQGKIERRHQTLKNCILLENYYLPGDLEAQIDAFVSPLVHFLALALTGALYHRGREYRSRYARNDSERLVQSRSRFATGFVRAELLPVRGLP